MNFNVDADINVHGPGSSAERTEYCKTWQEKERDKQYYKQRLAKWEQQQATTELKSETFKGVTVWISGYTDKSSDLQLKTLVAQHAGQISWFFSATRTTHIICTNLAATKIDRMLKRVGAKRFIPVVHPDWILHSVKQRKLLPEHDYRVIQPTNQHQIDQFFAKKSDGNSEVDDEDSISDSIEENLDKPKVIPRPIYSPKKTFNTTPLKLSPKKEKKQPAVDPKTNDITDKSNGKEDAKNATSNTDKENFVPLEGLQEANNNINKKDKALKNIDIRTGKVIKTSTTSAVNHVKKASSKPLAKLSLLANDRFKNIPNVAKKSGPVKK